MQQEDSNHGPWYRTFRLARSGHNQGWLSLEVAGQRFRVRTPQVSTQWLPYTPTNRHLIVVWFRLLVDEQGEPLFTFRS
jgi:hypothetical protein